MEGVDGISLPTQDTQASRNKEIRLNSGEKIAIPTLHVAKMQLFHGSSVADIPAFDIKHSDQMTIGRGIYFTPSRESAISYAKWRSDEKANPTLYEAEIKDADFADLRTRKAQEEFAKLLKQSLLNWEQNVLPNMKGPSEEATKIIKEQRKEMTAETVKKIDENSWIQLRDITFDWADLVSRTLSAQGYKGLMSIEGEPPKVEFHDSIVVFNPQDTPIVHQEAV